MLLQFIIGRSRCTLYAINNISVVKQCARRQTTRANVTVKLFRGLETGNASRRCQHVCCSMYSVHSHTTLMNGTFSVSDHLCIRQREHSYHTSTVSFLANKYNGTNGDEAADVTPPSTGKLRDDVNIKDLDDPEIVSILQDINTDFRTALNVNEIELEDQTHLPSESDILIESEMQAREEMSMGLSEELEPIDIDKELLKYDYEEFDDVYFEPEIEEAKEPTYPISLERGQSGVFDASELVTVLREENGRDICVIAVPKVMNYVDHVVLVTGRSTRHLRALAEYVRWLYKRKRGRSDPLTCKIEGLDTCKDWYAIDLGNIAAHFFLKTTRETYDLETLWTVGREYDDKVTEATADPFASLFTHEDFLAKFANKEQQEDPLRVNKETVEVKVTKETSKEIEYEGMENIAGWHDIMSKDRKEGNKT